MARLPRPTNDPEAVALGVLALRSYARENTPATQFEAEISRTLSQLGVAPAAAQKLVGNFDAIRPSVRRRVFGPLGLSDARLPANIPRGGRALPVQTSKSVLRPGFRARPDSLGNQGLPQPGEEILAPERYTVSYVGMHCVDETGFDFAGSDEIYIITSAIHIERDGTNAVQTIRHPLNEAGSGTYGDVDSHETRRGPVAASWSAAVPDIAVGISITTVFFEHDQGDPDAYRDEVDTAVKLAVALASYFFPPARPILILIEASGFVTDLFNSLLGTGDDEIGTTTTVLELSDLETYSRTALVDFAPIRNGRHVPTGLRHHFLAPVNENDYFAAFRVIRQPKAPLLPLPEVE